MKIRRKQKRILVLTILALAVIGLILLGFFVVNWLFFKPKADPEEPSLNVKISGTMPKELNQNVLKHSLIADGVKTDDGYFVPVAEKQATVIKYNKNGRKIWKKSYSVHSDSYTIKNILSLPDGGFVFTVNPTAADNGESNGSPAVYQCDSDGDLVWSQDYTDKGGSALDYIFAAGGGEILTAGNTPQGVYLTKLGADGEKIAEKTVGGASDTLANAAYIDGTGLSVLIDTKSKDGGTTSAVRLFGSDLLPAWNLTLPSAASDGSFCMNSQAIYTVSGDNMFIKISLDGNIAFQMKMGDGQMSLTSRQTDDTVVASTDTNLYVFDAAGSYIRTVNFDGGNVTKIWKSGDTLVVLSEKGNQLLYTAYNADGKQIGRAVCGK